MGSLLSTRTPAEKYLMLEYLSRSIREYGYSAAVDAIIAIIQCGHFLRVGFDFDDFFDHLGLNNVPSLYWQHVGRLQPYSLDQNLQIITVPADTQARAGTGTRFEDLRTLLCIVWELMDLAGVTSQSLIRLLGGIPMLMDQWPTPGILSTVVAGIVPQLMSILSNANVAPHANHFLHVRNGHSAFLSNLHIVRSWRREIAITNADSEVPLRLNIIKRDLATAFEEESTKFEDAPRTKRTMTHKQDDSAFNLNSLISGESTAVDSYSRRGTPIEPLCGNESEDNRPRKKLLTEKMSLCNSEIESEVGINHCEKIETKWAYISPCTFQGSQFTREGSISGYTKGIMILSWEMIDAILKFLPREFWKGLALSCKHFRVVLSSMALREEKVIIPGHESPAHWKLHFFTSDSFKMLNRHWRLGPLFQPVNRVTFSLPYDDNKQAVCMQLVLDHLKSLKPGVRHIEHVFVNLGYIGDGGGMTSSMKYELIRDLLQELYRSGCSKLTLMSVSTPDESNREEPASDILLNLHDEKLNLESLSVESPLFSHRAILPWVMRQVVESSTIKHLRLSGTGFTGAQLDNVLCYFDLPQLESLAIGGPWLATVVELLQGSPRVHTIHFQGLSDLRVQHDTIVSLPYLHSIRGDTTTLCRFIPLLTDVPWSSFSELELDVKVERGQNDSKVETLDVESCIEVFSQLIYACANLDTLAITFPRLDGFSGSLFDKVEELHGTMHALKVNHLQVQLRCETEREIGEVMDGMVPLVSAISSIQTLFVHSVTAQIGALDKYAFISSLAAVRPDVSVKFF